MLVKETMMLPILLMIGVWRCEWRENTKYRGGDYQLIV
jgi:hypothetical protein